MSTNSPARPDGSAFSLMAQAAVHEEAVVNAQPIPTFEVSVVASPPGVDDGSPAGGYLTFSPPHEGPSEAKSPGVVKTRVGENGWLTIEAEKERPDPDNPAATYMFEKWVENGQTLSLNQELTFPVNANRALEAHYIRDPNAVITVQVLGEGTISFSDNPGVEYDKKSPIKRPFQMDAPSFTVYAHAASGWVLDHWVTPESWTATSGEASKSAGSVPGMTIDSIETAYLAPVFVSKSDRVLHPADTNMDGAVDAADIKFVVDNKQSEHAVNADINRDCVVDSVDEQLVTSAALSVWPSSAFYVTAFGVGPGVLAFEILNGVTVSDPPHPHVQFGFDNREYPVGTQLRVTAYAADGFEFSHWGGMFTGVSRIQEFVVTENIHFSADFIESTRSATDLTDEDEDGLLLFREVELGTSPTNPDSDGDGMPDGWEVNFDDVLDPTKNDASNDPDNDCLKNIDEYAAKSPPNIRSTGFRLYREVEGEGEIAVSGDSELYPFGESLTFSAVPAKGYEFVRWEGALYARTSGIDQKLTVNGHTFVRAIFKRRVEIELTVEGEGTVQIDPGPGPYLQDTRITLEATPAAGWKFDHWDGPFRSTERTVVEFRIQHLSFITAVFVKE